MAERLSSRLSDASSRCTALSASARPADGLTRRPGVPGDDLVLAPWCRIVRDGDRPGLSKDPIKKPVDVVLLLTEVAALEEVEHFWAIYLDNQWRPLVVQTVSRGLVSSTLVHPREVFRLAVVFGASAVLVVHNHPSGQPEPSADDRACTKQLADAGRALDIPLVDHVILAGDRWFSFQEAGLLP